MVETLIWASSLSTLWSLVHVPSSHVVVPLLVHVVVPSLLLLRIVSSLVVVVSSLRVLLVVEVPVVPSLLLLRVVVVVEASVLRTSLLLRVTALVGTWTHVPSLLRTSEVAPSLLLRSWTTSEPLLWTSLALWPSAAEVLVLSSIVHRRVTLVRSVVRASVPVVLRGSLVGLAGSVRSPHVVLVLVLVSSFVSVHFILVACLLEMLF